MVGGGGAGMQRVLWARVRKRMVVVKGCMACERSRVAGVEPYFFPTKQEQGIVEEGDHMAGIYEFPSGIYVFCNSVILISSILLRMFSHDPCLDTEL